MNQIEVLSLFDGISAGQVALERAGIPVKSYVASEVDRFAIKVTQKNYPNTIQLGDVRNWRDWDDMKLDLLLAGFPCQSHSNAGKRQGLNDPRGKLMYDMLDIIEYYHPKDFLLENVKGLLSTDKGVVIQYIMDRLTGMGYNPCITVLNSALVSAQNRERVYITSFPVVGEPEDLGILLKDIVEDGECDRDKSYCIDANYSKGGNLHQYHVKGRRQMVRQSANRLMVQVGEAEGIKGHDYNRRVYSVEGKSPTLATHTGGNLEPKISTDNKSWRILYPSECERLQTFPEGYVTDAGISKTQQYKTLGNSFTVEMVSWLLSQLYGRV